MKLPLPRTQFSQKLSLTVGKICEDMLSRTRKEKETGGADQRDKSCLGLLCEFIFLFKNCEHYNCFTVNAEELGEGTGLTQQEVLDEVYDSLNPLEQFDIDLRLLQARVLLLAGFETTAGNMHSFNKEQYTYRITCTLSVSMTVGFEPCIASTTPLTSTPNFYSGLL
jgi:hypothetical protein